MASRTEIGGQHRVGVGDNQTSPAATSAAEDASKTTKTGCRLKLYDPYFKPHMTTGEGDQWIESCREIMDGLYCH